MVATAASANHERAQILARLDLACGHATEMQHRVAALRLYGAMKSACIWAVVSDAVHHLMAFRVAGKSISFGRRDEPTFFSWDEAERMRAVYAAKLQADDLVVINGAQWWELELAHLEILSGI